MLTWLHSAPGFTWNRRIQIVGLWQVEPSVEVEWVVVQDAAPVHLVLMLLWDHYRHSRRMWRGSCSTVKNYACQRKSVLLLIRTCFVECFVCIESISPACAGFCFSHNCLNRVWCKLYRVFGVLNNKKICLCIFLMLLSYGTDFLSVRNWIWMMEKGIYFKIF